MFCSRLNEEARKLIAELGSTSINNLGFRDNWVFCGGKGIKTKSPFEQVCSKANNFSEFSKSFYTSKGLVYLEVPLTGSCFEHTKVYYFTLLISM